MITALSIIGISWAIGTVLYFIAFRVNERDILNFVQDRKSNYHFRGHDEAIRRTVAAESALWHTKMSRLAPVWPVLLVWWSTAGIRKSIKRRREDIKVATKIVQEAK